MHTTNPYSITLDRAWTEWARWARNYGVPSTGAAAVFLMSEARPTHEVMAKLAAGEFEQVVDIVSRWPDRFPPGTPAALKSRRPIPSPDPPAVSNRFGIALNASFQRTVTAWASQ